MDRMTLPNLENHPKLQTYLDRAYKYLNENDKDAAGNNLRKAIETILQQYANDIPQVYDRNLSTMISSMRGLEALTEAQLDLLDDIRHRGNASSHADKPNKPKWDFSISALKNDYENLFDEILPDFLERYPAPVKKKPRVHPKYHANVDIRELGHPNILYAASRGFENGQWYPTSHAQMEQFEDGWNLHLGDAVRFYEEEIYLFWIGQSNIIENGELRIPPELQAFFGAGGFIKRSYVDKYHNMQYELEPLGFSLFNSIRYMRSYCTETLYLPYDFSALPGADWSLSQQPEDSLPEFVMDFDRRMFVKGIKCILIPHPSPGMKALSWNSWKRLFPELQLLLLDEEYKAFRSCIQEHSAQPVCWHQKLQFRYIYWPEWAVGYPPFKSSGLAQHEIEYLLSCFAMPMREVSKTLEEFGARHPEKPKLIVKNDDWQLKLPVPDWMEEELRLTGFDRRQFVDAFRSWYVNISMRPETPQDMSGDHERFYANRILTPVRCSMDSEGRTQNKYPSWALAAIPADPARAVEEARSVQVHALEQEFRKHLSTLPFDPFFDHSGILRSIHAEGKGAEWLISDSDFEQCFAESHADELAALATQYAEQENSEPPIFMIRKKGPFRIAASNEEGYCDLSSDSCIRCIRYKKNAGVCYDVCECLSLWPEIPQTQLAKDLTIDEQYDSALFPPSFFLPKPGMGIVLFYAWWWKQLIEEEGNCEVYRRTQIMQRAAEGARTKAFEAFLAKLPFDPLCPHGEPLQSIAVSSDNEWGLTPVEFEWEFARRRANQMEAASIDLAKRIAHNNNLPFSLPVFHAGDRVSHSGSNGKVTVVRYMPGNGYMYDLMEENLNGVALYMVRPNVREDQLVPVSKGPGSNLTTKTGPDSDSSTTVQGITQKEQKPKHSTKRGLLWRLTH